MTTNKTPPGTHMYTRGPQYLIDKTGKVIGKALTLTKARKMLKSFPDGTRIKSAFYVSLEKSEGIS